MRKGILLAGGTGKRLYPTTITINKHLLNVYDKPMIFYPLSTLMLGGIQDILIITNKNDVDLFKNLLGNGSNFGIKLTYEIQEKPNGIAQSFLIGEEFINNSPVTLILGDNLFHGNELINQLRNVSSETKGAHLFAYPVSDPERYGVVEFTKKAKVISIEEKPREPKSNYAITGLYFYDSTVCKKASLIKPSNRNELEISSINQLYLEEGNLNLEIMGRGMAWLDTGTCDSLHQASSYIRTLQLRQGLKIACPEEIAWRNGWINETKVRELSAKKMGSGYGEYLLELINRNNQIIIK